MSRILFVTTDGDYGSPATQIRLLAQGLPRDRFEVRACVLGPHGPAAKALAASGVPVTVLGWTRLFDGRPLWDLRRLMCQFRPHVIHAWRPAALRTALAAAWGLGTDDGAIPPPRFVASSALTASAAGGWGPLDRWLLRRADRVVVAGPSEAEHCQRLSVPPQRLAVIAPGVDVTQEDAAESQAVAQSLTAVLPPGARLLACVGPFEQHKGFRDALWAYGILHYLYADLHLLLIGTGPDRERLETFVRAMGAERTIHWLGPQPDIAAPLGLAETVWVPSRGPGGVHAALEAQAAGVPVVASSLPGLAEVVLESETGFLVPPGDKVAVARQTRLLLEDPQRRRRMGRRGRQHVAGRFAAADFARRFAHLYDSVLAQRPAVDEDSQKAGRELMSGSGSR